VKTDKDFFDDRYRLFDTDGWKDLVDELTLMADSVNNVVSIEDEKTLYLVKGQLTILNMLITLEETTKLADE
jgi:hypothetical protein|tara:strand:- start:138 stop:353 length:216 start_codon:yes stop_codon:yes gene_type:complete